MPTTPPHPSRYDELHDRYETLLSTKKGTRYERLAALVFKALDAQNAVIHDMKLVGDDPDVKHQIDVTINQAGTEKRILIECKDFDISGDKINLDIARSFRSVIEDTKADEGWMISCNGFTRDAQKYAKSKGIKLLILRIFEPKDMEGRVQRIVINLHAISATNIKIGVWTDSALQGELDGLLAGHTNTHPVWLVGPEGRLQMSDVLSNAVNATLKADDPACVHGAILPFNVPVHDHFVQVGNGKTYPVRAIRGEFEVMIDTRSFDVTSKRIAELLLKGFGADDLIIFDDQLKGFTINPDTGEAVARV